MKKEKELTGQATPEQIEAWKEQHGEIFAVVSGDSIAYLKKPTRSVVKAISAKAGGDPLGASEVALASCWLGGDENIRTNDDKFYAVHQVLGGLIEAQEAELKKL